MITRAFTARASTPPPRPAIRPWPRRSTRAPSGRTPPTRPAPGWTACACFKRSAMTQLTPFHIAFPVDDLEAARRFYGEVLGCPEGRSAPGEWIDFDLFGHQVVAH